MTVHFVLKAADRKSREARVDVLAGVATCPPKRKHPVVATIGLVIGKSLNGSVVGAP
jgi:hypothetical protein